MKNIIVVILLIFAGYYWYSNGAPTSPKAILSIVTHAGTPDIQRVIENNTLKISAGDVEAHFDLRSNSKTIKGMLLNTVKFTGVKNGAYGPIGFLGYLEPMSYALYIENYGHNSKVCPADFLNQYAQLKVIIPENEEIHKKLISIELYTPSDPSTWKKFQAKGRCVKMNGYSIKDDGKQIFLKGFAKECESFVISDISI